MAGRGRGRGRGLLVAKPSTPGGGNEPETKVGEGEVTQKDRRATEALQDLQRELTNLLQQGDDLVDDDLRRVEQLATLAFTSLEDVQAISKMLYDNVIKNHELAKGAAIVCDKLSNLEKEGTRFRSSILSLVQADYKNREELRRTSQDRFLGFLSLLSYLFITMRLANGEVMQPLVGAMYDCLELVIESDDIRDEEGEHITPLLQMIGRDLQDNGDERMQQLMGSVRTKIIVQETKPQVRCYLLEILESYLRRWQIAPNDITRFYLDSMADILANLVVNDS